MFGKKRRKVFKKRLTDYVEMKEMPFDWAMQKPLFKTKVKIKCFDNNKLVAPILVSHNATVFNGRVSIQELVFGGQPNPAQHLLLNDIEGIPHSVDVFSEGKNYHRLRTVDYFCIGNGAESTTLNGDIIQERTSDTKLYNMVPFRCVPVSSDLSEEEASRYRLRKKISIKGTDYYAYYAKKFEKSAIKVIYNGNNYIPKSSDTSTLPDTDDTKPLRSGQVTIYSVLNINIEPKDFKEYYQAMNNGSLSLARISEIGLISGLDAPNALNSNNLELAGAELFAKMCFSAIPMETATSSVELAYEMYT